MFDLILILADGTSPDDAIGWAERLNKGGVPVIALVVAIAAVIGLLYLFKRLLDEQKERANLELTYRKDLEERHKQAISDAEKRLEAAKNEAKERAAEVKELMRERMQAEKESDATLAQAVRVIEANTKIMERTERHLDRREA